MAGDEERSEVRTFLIADVRGYTRFTQTRGDEAAAALAARFAAIVQDVVEQRDGRLLELRGDEALVVFSSPRQAIRCAVELQARFVDETIADPSLPLGVGVGIDSGEAIPVRGGYRGAALNLAARLCSTAAAGQVLASGEATHLARRIDGLKYVERGRATFKGIDQPVLVVAVVPQADDPTRRREFVDAVHPPDLVALARRRRDRLRAMLIAVAAGVLLITDVTVVIHRATAVKPLPAIGTNAVGRVSLSDNVLHARVPVGAGPGPIAADSAAVWVVNTIDGTVSKIDTADPQAPSNTIPVGSSPAGIALGAGSVWVTDEADRLVSRVSPKTSTVVDTIPVGNAPVAVDYAFGHVWVANELDDTVSVIDPQKFGPSAVVATIQVGAGPAGIAAGFGSIWVANSGSSLVTRVDPTSMRVVAGVPVGNSPQALTVDPSGVWVSNTLDGTVSHIAPASNSVAATVTVGSEPTGITNSGDAVWVANSNSDSISRIDPASDRVVATISVGNAPQQATVADGDLWVSAQGAASQHGGGTFRIVAEHDDLPSLDPANSYFSLAGGLIPDLYDGLVAFRHTAGPVGAQIVPDLAVGLPTISDGGRSYTFQLRRGIRYSNGSLLHPSDVRFSFERVFRVGEASSTGYFNGIVGASSCSTKACDLSRGIVTDDTTGTVTFHLSAPDPNFLDELALPFGVVVPPTAPEADQGLERGIPGTGPYQVGALSATQLHLIRNPYFHVWSPLAQPAGYPGAIDVTLTKGNFGSASDENAAAVARGSYDWTPDFPNKITGRLVRTKGDQLHAYSLSGLHFYALNTQQKPFTDVRVRRAVNDALDRRALVQAVGGPLAAQESCQALPTTVSGYRPYCPYTRNPNSTGTWTAPDVAKGRRLVQAAGATGAHVTVIARADLPQLGTIVAHAMRQVGLDAKVRVLPTSLSYFGYIADSTNHVQAALSGWALDFPAPANIVEPLLACASVQPHSTMNVNTSLFCNRSVDAATHRAADLQTSDPAAAVSAWAQVDKLVTDQAPWVFLYDDRRYDVVSSRVGNYERNPQYGMLIDQAWVH